MVSPFHIFFDCPVSEFHVFFHFGVHSRISESNMLSRLVWVSPIGHFMVNHKDEIAGVWLLCLWLCCKKFSNFAWRYIPWRYHIHWPVLWLLNRQHKAEHHGSKPFPSIQPKSIDRKSNQLSVYHPNLLLHAQFKKKMYMPLINSMLPYMDTNSVVRALIQELLSSGSTGKTQ